MTTIQVNKSALIAALERCAAIAADKSPMPVLKHAFFVCDGGLLSYTATDLKIAVSGSLSAAGKGQFLVSPKGMLSAVKTLPGETVKIAVDSKALTVSGDGKRKFKLAVTSDEFPKINAMPDKALALPADFRFGLQRVMYAMRQESGDDQPAQRTIRVRIRGGVASFAATDGHRLASFSMPADGEAEFLVPTYAVRHLLNSEGDMAFACVGDELFFRTGGDVFSIRKMVADFPPVENYLGVALSETLAVDVPALADAVAAVSQVSPSVVLQLTGTSLHISAETGDNESTDEIAAECSTPIELAFTAKYLLESLRGLEGEIKLSYGLDQFQLLKVTNEGYSAIVMPIALAVARAAAE
jgi:DNA polymerase-3 subunit beta